MSVVTVRSIFCDCEHPDPCGEWFGDEPEISPTLVRRLARQHGWTARRTDGQTFDRCPSCSKGHR